MAPGAAPQALLIISAIFGTFLGVLFIGLLSNGMVLMGINPFAQEVIRGLIILVAVLISVIRTKDV